MPMMEIIVVMTTGISHIQCFFENKINEFMEEETVFCHPILGSSLVSILNPKYL